MHENFSTKHNAGPLGSNLSTHVHHPLLPVLSLPQDPLPSHSTDTGPMVPQHVCCSPLLSLSHPDGPS
ncbi:hypothetical protein CesoFtcFv8_007747 [Champsocephalus esox]|uniref:Uncharacterized protein n=2 Tax=Champsocephalus TaxID=52236 RepID=A0AAN8DUA1_CHAGU|nr:hypothetical protein CesoFtcFv8_007747 [Champsocephalus esox]KAK5928270.1 hypothetical protein CgunFtcFv8_013345 [Champsocephalus gunnari]